MCGPSVARVTRTSQQATRLLRFEWRLLSEQRSTPSQLIPVEQRDFPKRAQFAVREPSMVSPGRFPKAGWFSCGIAGPPDGVELRIPVIVLRVCPEMLLGALAPVSRKGHRPASRTAGHRLVGDRAVSDWTVNPPSLPCRMIS